VGVAERMADASNRRIAAAIALGTAVLSMVLVPVSVRPLERGHDAGFTYGYLRSIVLDGDLDFSDDAHPFDSSMPHTAEGYTHNGFPMGPAVWWSPAFVTAHGVAASARVVTGADDPEPDGRSWPFQLLVVWATLAVGVVGLWATYAACRTMASSAGAALGTAAVWLGGAPLYYLHVNATQGHAAAFASAALLLATWLRFRTRPDPSLWRVAGIGLLAGLLVITRWQYAVLLLGPGLDVVLGRLRGRQPVDARGTAALAGAFLLAVSPQMIVWNTLYGSPFRPPRGEASGAFLDLGDLHLLDVLVSWRHGLFSWHPLFLAGLVGLAIALRRHRFVAGSLLVTLAATIFVNAGVIDWWGGVSFGARRFDGMWPVFALGLAVVADRVPRRAAIGAVTAAALVNWTLMMAFASHLVSQVDAVRPGDLLDVVGDIRWLPQLDAWNGHKVAWVAGLAALALVPRLAGTRRPPFLDRPRQLVGAGLAVAAVVAATTALAAREPGSYDGNVFEAAYFVPQESRPSGIRRTVTEDDEVWTLIWAFPGFLEPGRYVASATGVEGTGELAVRVDGATVTRGAAGDEAADLAGRPFDLDGGFIRLDLAVEGGPISLDTITLEPVEPAG